MVLTSKGQVFLLNIGDTLHAIRKAKAKAEASAGNISVASYLRLVTIVDFESGIIPELAEILSNRMRCCDFMHRTDSGHAILAMLRDRQLDLGITTTPSKRLRQLQDTPLLPDPFLVVMPKSGEHALQEVINGRSRLPFLRFTSNRSSPARLNPCCGGWSCRCRIGLNAPAIKH
ncbi:LysR substrate-binding domain-containing protein [Leisingera methylohalidivorans]|uniref:LysR substrate-binding domain-containing protein n=1 Tax=Leisingera methylohalidivorans TaxID=133924 RepID=UPI000419DD69|nr:LysR substrate-binding domain-containing protein [Leisingera methylohalidivorans]